MTMQTRFRAFAAFASLLFTGCASIPDTASHAQSLFEKHWDEVARLYPTAATYRGDHRYGDRHVDRTPEGLAREERYWKALLGDVRKLEGATLSRQDRRSLEILGHIAASNVEGHQHAGLRTYTVHAGFFPFHTFFPRLLAVSPMDSELRAEQVLSRMAAYPARIDQEIALLRRGIALGWVPPRPVLERVVAQLDGQLGIAAADSAYVEPFKRLGAGIPEPAREALRKRGLAAAEQHAYPAMRKLREFLATEYMKAAPPEGGLSRYPGGAEAYAYLVRDETTTSLAPRQIHRLGLEKIASIRAEMEALMRTTGFGGDLPAFFKYLNTDSRFFHRSPEELLADYRDIAKRLDAEMPKLFAELPRATYGVRSIPAYQGTGAVETYSSPSLDGTRPGWFNANTAGYKIRPKWGMPAIAAHETVPGHHIQFARAAEIRGVPAFRRSAGFTAYSEGWGLYAEVLADEIGFYSDPYSRFGYLQNQAWRAARLVVDTGLHSEGWTRQRAIDYMIENTGMASERVTSEVDRYLSLPGQALSYMIGQIRIQELRARAREALGARFDLRRFHMAVLDSGQVPLDVLDRIVEDWIEEEKKLGSRVTAP